MRCSRAHEYIVQHIYDELPEEACRRLERHLAGCERCRKDLDEYEALRRDLSLIPVEEPSPSLLAASRIRLENAIDELPPAGLWQRMETGFLGFFAQLHAAPGVALALAALGIGIGAAGGRYWNDHRSAMQNTPVVSEAKMVKPAGVGPAPTVVRVNRIVRHPNTKMVEVHFNRMVPETVEGPMSDPEVRKLLLQASADSSHPLVQSDSVDLLAGQCKEGRDCDGAPVRTALMVALRYDHNPTVRLTALEGLAPYIGQDARVRDAVLESLLHDPYEVIRSRALHMLAPVQADSSVHMVLQTVSTQDINPTMREASLKVLAAAPPTE
jgi:hypothetical protein